MKSSPEFDRIRAFVDAVRAPASAAALAPGDDSAVLHPVGGPIVLSTDAFVEGVHFRREWSRWESIGYRAAAAALSDLAAMAARPLGVLVSLMVPPEIEERTLVAIGKGFGDCLRRYGTGLLGGDLTHSLAAVAIDVCVVGTGTSVVTRAGARSGDEVWITGEVGGAGAALRAWRRSMEPDPRARAAFERPTPRISEALWLREHAGLTALIDLSDGLAGDARQLAAASGARLIIDLDAVPLASPLSEYESRETALHLALAAGEDYELLLCSQAGSVKALAAEFERRFGVPLTRIGEVVDGEGVVFTSELGVSVPATLDGYDHFASGDG